VAKLHNNRISDLATGNNGNAHLDDSAMRRVMDALEDPRYDWRTIEGIAEQTGVDPSTVRAVLKRNQNTKLSAPRFQTNQDAVYTPRAGATGKQTDLGLES
jgi:hypothetical protein